MSNKYKKYCKGCYFNDAASPDYCGECWDCELLKEPDKEPKPTNYVKDAPYYE